MPTISYVTAWRVYLSPNPDLYQWDLGEFVHKGTVATRWGTREELLHACKVANEHGIDILIDAVLNVCPLSCSLSPSSQLFHF